MVGRVKLNGMTIIKNLKIVKILFVLIFSISIPMLTVILLNPLFFGPENRTIDSALSNLSMAMMAFVISLILGIFFALKLKENILRIFFNSFIVLFLFEIIFLIVANMNNWWRT